MTTREGGSLLDLPVLSGITALASVFDPEYANTQSLITFLPRLRRRMARAVMSEDLDYDYLPTQAIADFLAAVR